MSANGFNGTLSDEQHQSSSGSVEVKNKPIGLDQLSVRLLTESEHESKVIFKGLLIRRERLEDDSDDRFALYWAVLRAKQLFLFHNESSPRCLEVIMLSQFVCKPETDASSSSLSGSWPKGLKTCTLTTAVATTDSIGSNSSGSCGSDRGRLHRLAWWPAHYNWQAHIPNQAARARDNPAASQTESRQLLIAAQELRRCWAEAAAAEAFVPPELPTRIKLEKSKKGLLGMLRLSSNSREAKSDAPLPSTTTNLPPPEEERPQSVDDEEDVYNELQEDTYTELQNTDEMDTYEVPTTTPQIVQSPTPQIVQSPTPQIVQSPTAQIVQSPKPQIVQSPTPQLPPKPCNITKEMLNRQKLRPAALPALRPSVDVGEALPPPQLPKPRPTTTPQSSSNSGQLWQQLMSNEAVDASVSYFYHAHDSEAGLHEVARKLVTSPAGTFLVHGCAKNSHRALLTLLVQSGSGVCRFYIKETNAGVRITTSETCHSSLNQLLFHHHLHDLPPCKESQAPLRLLRPPTLPGRSNVFSASLWCLGDKALCMSLLEGTADGTYALVIDPTTRQISLYVTADKERVKLRVQVQRLSADQAKFWVNEREKFDTLEEFLTQYHLRNLAMTTESGKSTSVRLVTPCQVSEKFCSNLLTYLTAHVEETAMEVAAATPADAPPAVVSTKRYFNASIRTETQLDDDEFQTTLTVGGHQSSQSAVHVQETLVRGFQCIYSVLGRPEVKFDSPDKLLLYANQHPGKLHG